MLKPLPTGPYLSGAARRSRGLRVSSREVQVPNGWAHRGAVCPCGLTSRPASSETPGLPAAAAACDREGQGLQDMCARAGGGRRSEHAKRMPAQRMRKGCAKPRERAEHAEPCQHGRPLALNIYKEQTRRSNGASSLILRLPMVPVDESRLAAGRQLGLGPKELHACLSPVFTSAMVHFHDVRCDGRGKGGAASVAHGEQAFKAKG